MVIACFAKKNAGECATACVKGFVVETTLLIVVKTTLLIVVENTLKAGFTRSVFNLD